MKYTITGLYLCVLALAGCDNSQDPNAFYTAYYKKSAEGIATLDEDAKHFSARKRDEVEQKFPAMMQGMNKSWEEVAQIYLQMSKAVAKCKNIELESEKTVGDIAVLVYRQTDVCGNVSQGPEKQKIRLVKEGGWKIDQVEIGL